MKKEEHVGKYMEVWGDTVVPKELAASAVICVILTMVFFLAGRTVLTGIDSLEPALAKGYSLLVGIVGTFLGATICAKKFKPKRKIMIEFQEENIEDILKAAAEKDEAPFLVMLDELEDPHNLGALLRTADATGVHGILIPKRRSVSLNATVAKTSAGAVEYVPVARIGNIAQTLKALKEKGFWVAGADMDGEKAYYEADLTGPLVLVVGSEGRGMSRLTKEACDFIVSMPMVGHINSLNASVAGSILMYESMRQRLAKRNC